MQHLSFRAISTSTYLSAAALVFLVSACGSGDDDTAEASSGIGSNSTDDGSEPSGGDNGPATPAAAGTETSGSGQPSGTNFATPPPEPPTEFVGEDVYGKPLFGGNTFTCATCHALSEPAADGLRRPGHAFADVLKRPTYKNGRLDEFVDAANTCRSDWMGIREPWTTDSPEYLALEEYLGEQTSSDQAETPPLTFTIEQPPELSALMGGTPSAGQETFNGTCAVCHGEDAAGTELAPALLGARLSAELIAQRVRTSGSPNSVAYDGLTGGRMPFWSKERLSDDELEDIVAFVLANDPGQPGEVEMPTTGVRECEATHPNVGKTATLKNLFHDVGGVATIVDDCTVRIDNFTFDGGGIDVRIYAGLAGDYDAGFALDGDNLVRVQPYDGETVTVNVPEGMSLDDFDGVSVWCVPIGINFGDGSFE